MKIELISPKLTDTLQFYNLIDANREHLKNLVWVKDATEASTKQFLMKVILGEPFFRLIEVDDQIAGTITIRQEADGFSIGYWVAKEFSGMGVASLAVNKMLKVFTKGRIVHARVRRFNEGSLKVLEKNGFVIIGEQKIDNETWFTLARLV